MESISGKNCISNEGKKNTKIFTKKTYTSSHISIFSPNHLKNSNAQSQFAEAAKRIIVLLVILQIHLKEVIWTLSLGCFIIRYNNSYCVSTFFFIYPFENLFIYFHLVYCFDY